MTSAPHLSEHAAGTLSVPEGTQSSQVPPKHRTHQDDLSGISGSTEIREQHGLAVKGANLQTLHQFLKLRVSSSKEP